MTRILGIDWLVFYLICKNIIVEFMLNFYWALMERGMFLLFWASLFIEYLSFFCSFLFMLRKWCWWFHGMMYIIARLCCIDLGKRFAWVIGVVCMKILTNGEIENQIYFFAIPFLIKNTTDMTKRQDNLLTQQIRKPFIWITIFLFQSWCNPY